jgi:hypothetical protein
MWELRDKARRKWWFYVNLKRTLEEFSPNSWSKIGGSVYLVSERHSNEFRELLEHFEGPELKRYESKIEAQRRPRHCTAVHTSTAKLTAKS